MQILNLIGKYDQASIPAAQQEQIAKAGTQQLTASISSLGAGEVFEGTVREISGNQVYLMLGNGESVSAKLEGAVNLTLNQSMFFEVKSNTGSQIAIKPYLNGIVANPTLMKALTQAGLGVTSDHLDMVKSMMEQQMPIDRGSLAQMARHLASFPAAQPQTLVQMVKLGIPLTEANIQQFMNYKADAATVLNGLGEVIDQLPQALVGEGATAEQILGQHAKMLEIFLGQNIEGGIGGMGEGEANAAGQALPLSDSADGTVTAKAVPGETQSARAGQAAQQPDGALGGAQDSVKGQALAEAQALAQSQGSALSDVLDEAGMASLQRQLQRMGIPKDGNLLGEDGQLNAKLSSAEFLQKLQDQMQEGRLPSAAALERLFQGKEYKALLKDAVSRQWLLEPQQVQEKQNVEKLYQRLEEQMGKLEQFAKQNGLEHAGLEKAAASVRENLEFMNEINQIYNFVQIPLKMSGQNANSELYVYTNKRNPRDPDGELSAFLHLDMDHLGSTDVSVKMKGTAVKTNFYMEDDASYALILAHLLDLTEKLEQKGYQCQVEVINEKRKMDFVEDFLKRDVPSAGKVFRYSFDVRA